MRIHRIYRVPVPFRRHARKVLVQWADDQEAGMVTQGVPDHIPDSEIGRWLEQNCERQLVGWQEIEGRERDADKAVPPVDRDGSPANAMWG